MVRWLRWHCPPDTEFEIRALAVWGRARYLSVTEAPHNTNFHTWMGKKQFCFFQTAETGNRTPDSGVKGSGANHYPRAPAHITNTEIYVSLNLWPITFVCNWTHITNTKKIANTEILHLFQTCQFIILTGLWMPIRGKQVPNSHAKVACKTWGHSERWSVCQYSMAEENPAAQRQTAVTAHILSEQLLLFVFARRSVCQYSMAKENPAAQRQTAVTAYFSSEQLLLLAFVVQYSRPNAVSMVGQYRRCCAIIHRPVIGQQPGVRTPE